MGDNVNLAVGQGDLQADPLQMAVAYAAIANGGDVVRPHVGMEVEDPNGSVVQEIDPAPQRHLDINPQYRQAILEGIHMAAQSPGGTSYPVFGNFPIPMAGKTGTAQRPGQADQSWYMCAGAVSEPADRRRGDDRAGRVRRRRRGAGGARRSSTPTTTSTTDEAKAAGGKAPKQAPDPADRHRPAVAREPLLMVSDAYPRPFDGARDAPAPRERGGLLGLDPLLLLRGARADRLQPLHPGRGRPAATSRTTPTSTSSGRRSTP